MHKTIESLARKKIYNFFFRFVWGNHARGVDVDFFLRQGFDTVFCKIIGPRELVD